MQLEAHAIDGQEFNHQKGDISGCSNPASNAIHIAQSSRKLHL